MHTTNYVYYKDIVIGTLYSGTSSMIPIPLYFKRVLKTPNRLWYSSQIFCQSKSKQNTEKDSKLLTYMFLLTTFLFKESSWGMHALSSKCKPNSRAVIVTYLTQSTNLCTLGVIKRGADHTWSQYDSTHSSLCTLVVGAVGTPGASFLNI